MAEQNGTTTLKDNNTAAPSDAKGKGKAAADPATHDVSMDGDDSSSEEEVDDVSDLSLVRLFAYVVLTLHRMSPFVSFTIVSKQFYSIDL